jgi:hypothetical protein
VAEVFEELSENFLSSLLGTVNEEAKLMLGWETSESNGFRGSPKKN